ncbi:Gp63-1 surface protease homolog, putative [Trypanosoma brucei brucei TREU927]|uniref:Leishmanolysin-like peptidase n=1 Tax=Trypanosoma brucei brucei (strain 927/4 GUTat10.1) TaxID=185431 RepID=Q384P2_TRYB2|nr:Gp63-1 surface protease homolog, putative [Trypanosoma brucei brucei TREU927]EAN79739.1 Gp63-1 surface protease homolog, putative [Trypanosoma brucei brucei TREU927]
MAVIMFPRYIIPFLLGLILCGDVSEGNIPPHRCDFGKLMKNMSVREPPVVDEPPVPKGDLVHAIATSSTAGWHPIRVQVFDFDIKNRNKYCEKEGQVRSNFRDAYYECTTASVLTKEKKALLAVVIPDALKMHTDRLMVQPVHDPIKVYEKQTFCNNFSIPRDHYTTGVSGADMVLYGAAGPMGSPAAWAGPCSRVSGQRPTVGVFNIGPEVLTSHDSSMRVTAHEIAHALGFGFDIMEELKLVEKKSGIRGKNDVWVVTSPTVVKKAQEFYGCNEIKGVELEDEGGDGTKNSHWERRIAMEEMMTGLKSSDGGRYSVLTMALFEDMGFYRAKWGNEEDMHFGKGRGCDFLEKRCVENGRSNFPDVFCTSKARDTEIFCTSDRGGLGSCAIQTHESPIPEQYRYFADEKKGGPAELLDYCPYIRLFSNTGCTDGNPNVMLGSRVGPNSRCVKGTRLRLQKKKGVPLADICVEVNCESDILQVRFVGDNRWYDCPEGRNVTSNVTFSSGSIQCPEKSELCASKILRRITVPSAVAFPVTSPGPSTGPFAAPFAETYEGASPTSSTGASEDFSEEYSEESSHEDSEGSSPMTRQLTGTSSWSAYSSYLMWNMLLFVSCFSLL